MDQLLHFDIHPQPDDITCGPTCLHALYRFYGDMIELEQVIREVPMFELGGTLAVHLGFHALQRGYRARIFTYNLYVFDPSWLVRGPNDLAGKLRARAAAKSDPKLVHACEAYVRFLELGGRLHLADLTPQLIRRYLDRSQPILTGLSATWLYQSAREIPSTNDYDDVRGEPSGHFVVLCGYDKRTHEVFVADPHQPNPLGQQQLIYRVPVDRVISAILLGVITYDANLLIIEPGGPGDAQHGRR